MCPVNVQTNRATRVGVSLTYTIYVINQADSLRVAEASGCPEKPRTCKGLQQSRGNLATSIRIAIPDLAGMSLRLNDS
jgi:hypothetical protein